MVLCMSSQAPGPFLRIHKSALYIAPLPLQAQAGRMELPPKPPACFRAGDTIDVTCTSPSPGQVAQGVSIGASTTAMPIDTRSESGGAAEAHNSTAGPRQGWTDANWKAHAEKLGAKGTTGIDYSASQLRESLSRTAPPTAPPKPGPPQPDLPGQANAAIPKVRQRWRATTTHMRTTQSRAAFTQRQGVRKTTGQGRLDAQAPQPGGSQPRRRRPSNKGAQNAQNTREFLPWFLGLATFL